MDKIINAFSRNYSMNICKSPEEIFEAHQVRHKVFCEEKGWEKCNNLAAEYDQYDSSAIHILARDKEGVAVGTVRLIVSNILPINKYLTDNHIFNPIHQRPGIVAELSRLAVLEKYRTSGLAQGLLLAAGYISGEYKISQVYCMMENKLSNAIVRIGIRSNKISGTFEMRGTRAVYCLLTTDFQNAFASQLGYDMDKYDEVFKRLGNLKK